MAQSTATVANNPKKRRSTILSSQGHKETGDEQIHQGNREKKLPRETHQLVVSEARQRRANPDKNKEQKTDFSQEPENWSQHRHQRREQEYARTTKENDAEGRKRNAIERTD